MALKQDTLNLSGECSVETALSLVAGKWKPLLIFHLMAGTKRFSELQRLIPETSDRMLIKSLKELENDGLVNRKVMTEKPARVEYTLTVDGENLYPILENIGHWLAKRQN